jgi:hypothetical protein
MSVLAFRAVVLAMLIQKVEATKGDAWSVGSLLGWFSGFTRPVSQSDVAGYIWRLVCLVGWSPFFSLESWGFIWYRVYGVIYPDRWIVYIVCPKMHTRRYDENVEGHDDDIYQEEIEVEHNFMVSNGVGLPELDTGGLELLDEEVGPSNKCI